MSIERLSGGLTPADGADPRTFPAIWNATADDLEAGDYSRVPTGGSAGQVLVKDSATDYDADWDTISAVPVQTGFPVFPQPGEYFSTNNRGAGATMVNGRLYLSLVYFPIRMTIDRLACQVTTADASATIKMGAYEFVPGATTAQSVGGLLVESTGVSAATTGTKTETISEFVAGPGLVWFGIVAQGGTPSVFRVHDIGGPLTLPSTNAGFVTFGSIGLSQDSVSGAFPNPFTSTSLIGICMQVFGRRKP